MEGFKRALSQKFSLNFPQNSQKHAKTGGAGCTVYRHISETHRKSTILYSLWLSASLSIFELCIKNFHIYCAVPKTP